MIREAILSLSSRSSTVRCRLCSHRCLIGKSRFGWCGQRQNLGGRLVTHAYGAVVAAQVNPIESLGLFHFLPGSDTLSIATLGCTFRCGFCQNWEISQPAERAGSAPASAPLSPAEVVAMAASKGVQSISYTYTEPTVFFEYVLDIARLARAQGRSNVFATNGYLTEEALGTVAPLLDACIVDLKSFSNRFYEQVCQASVNPVLQSIMLLKRLGIWTEISTLVIPGYNDSDGDLGAIARFLAGIDPEMPWHVNRFQPEYLFQNVPETPLSTLQRAAGLGRKAGLQHVYIGNVIGGSADTLCPDCRAVMVHRNSILAVELDLRARGCPACGRAIGGIFRPEDLPTRRKERSVQRRQARA